MQNIHVQLTVSEKAQRQSQYFFTFHIISYEIFRYSLLWYLDIVK